ncbi:MULTISPECIES: hypothetical protein [unclassified Endozoicomonas]|uniref:hypothetical protein n=1 Tax=unclassified Endozoicomonas TaxID=2644528 RepID=UPI002147DFE5|nr:MULTISPECIES: hypothetical protein [unclassified Endozoicomonas]
MKSMGSGQGVQLPLLQRVTPQKVKTLASATAGLVLGSVATAGAYACGLVSGFTCAQTLVSTPQRSVETDEEHANPVKAKNIMPGWTRKENYLQFRERRDRTTKMYEHGWEKYFRENVPEWSFSHAKSTPYSYTLSAFFEWQQDNDKKLSCHDREMPLGRQ